MTTSERIGQWWASRQQTTADVEAHYGVQPGQVQPSVRAPLTTNQHILHLLLTIVTCGLWLPVWIIRAAVGNRTG